MCRGGAAFLLIVAATSAVNAASVVIEIQAGDHDRQGTPVVVPVPELLKDAPAFALEDLDDHRPVDVQLVPGETRRVAWIVRAPLPAGKARRYRLTSSDATPRSKADAVCADDGKQLTLAVGGRPVLSYHHAVVESPKGLGSYYRRSGQIHPIFTPSGLVVTDDFPPDHAHQHGLFFAWVNTTFAGKHVDFWNQKEQTGRIAHAEVVDTVSGPVFAQFSVRLRHEVLTDPAGPVPALDETWTVRAYNLSDPFVVDLESRQSASGPRLLAINQYHYGGMGIRGSRAWFDPTVTGNNPPNPSRSGHSDFLTSEGKGRADGNHTRPRWVDLSGSVEGRQAGITAFDHPDNFRFPQPVRLHPNKPYFCFAPMVLGAFEIAPGHSYVSRYRFATHDGLPDRAAIEHLWNDFADPPRVRAVKAAGEE